MSKNLQAFISFCILMAGIFWSFYGTMPQKVFDQDESNTSFSTTRAFEHIEAIAQAPHYVGTENHKEVRAYLENELKALGLEVVTQEGWSLNKKGTFTKPINILAKKEGTGQGNSLLIMSHYDSAVHSSPGASDAASGVATILEGLRAFIASGKTHENDIVVLFTDAEELGLNGANLFLEHPWAKEVGLALNFESRGSGGSSFMLLETNGANKNLIQHFIKANPSYPVTNSLAYSVYKMLPNDTDLTVLREQANINGFNFAFIDDHFDYHTATDTPENLDENTLAHQGSYLMPLLDYFSSVPLDKLQAEEDVIYFNLPVFDMVSYPFSWTVPLLALAGFLFLMLVFYGLLKREYRPSEILKGFLPFLITLVSSGVLAYALWKFCLFLYPEYQEMEHGFTYNGYLYIAAVIFLALGISFYSYKRFQTEANPAVLFIAPLFAWLCLCSLAALFLEGAAYFIIPVFFGLLQLFMLIQYKKPSVILMSLLCIPGIFILMPFVVTFPVALGLQILFVTAILVVFLWTLAWPVFGYYKKNQSLGFLCILTFFTLFIIAHFQSEFNEERPKPNSLVYLLDTDSQTATWNTYDKMKDDWTAPFFEEEAQPKNVKALFDSKYNSGFASSVKAPLVNIPQPTVNTTLINPDSLGNSHYHVEIIPHRSINRIELFTEDIVDFESFKVNDQTAAGLTSEENPLHVFKKRWNNRLLSYYAVGQDTLRLDFSIERGKAPNILMYEASHDLLQNKALDVPARAEDMIPRPFVLNDAVVLKKTIRLQEEN